MKTILALFFFAGGLLAASATDVAIQLTRAGDGGAVANRKLIITPLDVDSAGGGIAPGDTTVTNTDASGFVIVSNMAPGHFTVEITAPPNKKTYCINVPDSAELQYMTNLTVLFPDRIYPPGFTTYSEQAIDAKLNAIQISGGGEVNTGGNVGTGAGIFAGKIGVQLNFNRLAGAGGATVQSNNNTITVDISTAVTNATASGGATVSKVGQQLSIAADAPGAAAAVTNNNLLFWAQWKTNALGSNSMFSGTMGPNTFGTRFGIGAAADPDVGSAGTAFGHNANGSDGGAAFGEGAVGHGDGVAVGQNANANEHGVAVGEASSGTQGGTAFGEEALGDLGLALGSFANGTNGGTATGVESLGYNYGVGVGQFADGHGIGNIAIGSYDVNSVTLPAVVPDGWTYTTELGAGTATLQGGLNFRGFGLFDTNGFLLADRAATNFSGASDGWVLSLSGHRLKLIPASGAGTVTSVGMTVPSVLGISGSPVTGSGTLAVTATVRFETNNGAISSGSMLKSTGGDGLGAATAGSDYVAPATTVTTAGTANQINSSTATAQPLSGNVSTTLSLSSTLITPGTLNVTGNQTNQGTLSVTGNATNFGGTYLRGSVNITGPSTNIGNAYFQGSMNGNGSGLTNLNAQNLTNGVQVDPVSTTNNYAAFDSNGQLYGTNLITGTTLTGTNITLSFNGGEQMFTITNDGPDIFFTAPSPVRGHTGFLIKPSSGGHVTLHMPYPITFYPNATNSVATNATLYFDCWGKTNYGFMVGSILEAQ